MKEHHSDGKRGDLHLIIAKIRLITKRLYTFCDDCAVFSKTANRLSPRKPSITRRAGSKVTGCIKAMICRSRTGCHFQHLRDRLGCSGFPRTDSSVRKDFSSKSEDVTWRHFSSALRLEFANYQSKVDARGVAMIDSFSLAA
jgi:hypothetical protein